MSRRSRSSLFTPDLDLFDLQRVEVLRGPQGTLFGSGSLAGTLRYITQQPQLGKFGGAIEVGDFDGSSATRIRRRREGRA